MHYQLCPSYFNRIWRKRLARRTVEKKLENSSWIHIQDSMLFWVLLSYLGKYIAEYLCQLLQLCHFLQGAWSQ